MSFKSVKFFVSGFRIVYHYFARQCKLMYRKNSHKTSSRFFFLIVFFIVRLPHWVLDLSLNAQPSVNKFYLLFIYIPHFMMKLCRMCSKYLLSVLLSEYYEVLGIILPTFNIAVPVISYTWFLSWQTCGSIKFPSKVF